MTPSHPKGQAEPHTRYSAYTAFMTEGGRIGIVTCRICGSAVVLDEEKATERHEAWHDEARWIRRPL